MEKRLGGEGLNGDVGERCRDVVAIIVTYNPDVNVFFRGLAAIARQVGLVVVVDNASRELPVEKVKALAHEASIEAKTIVLPSNEGLGAAYNAGISEARARGFPYIALFDQDSVPQEGMIARLKQACSALSDKGLHVAAVGPRFRSPESGSLSDFRNFTRGYVRLVRCNRLVGTVEAGFLISSGSLIPMHAIDAIGSMDESLFIDHVDTEWCLRAKEKGWNIYGVCDAIMEHSLGEQRHRFWLLHWRYVSLHAPFRYYYIFRNGLLLRHRNDLPRDCRKAILKRDIMLAVYLMLLPIHHGENIRMMWRGVADGMRKVSGPMNFDES